MAKYAPTVPRMSTRIFMITAFDSDNPGDARERCLDAHLEYVEKHCDEYLVCGPMRPVGEASLGGSFFLVAASDEAEADRIVGGDPYFKSGLYGRIEKSEFTASAGRWMGGVIWESADEIRQYATKARPVTES
ncbi:MAG: YciI family protein [Woeseiaceae bacterium]